jgi:hypothetical protein
MLNSTTLEVAIGLALVFLLLSLFCTAINEAIAAVLGARARTLEKGIQSLFSGGQIHVIDDNNVATLRSLTDVVYNHGLIQSLYKGSPAQTFTSASRIAPRELPSYIPSRIFASTLFDILFSEPVQPLRENSPAAKLKSMIDSVQKMPDSKAKEALLLLVREAGGDVAATRQAIERWYNDGMDRVSGWYKRRTQLVLFGLGLSVAILLNIDTISVAKTFWASPAARAFAIKKAEGYASGPTETATSGAKPALLSGKSSTSSQTGASDKPSPTLPANASEQIEALGELALPLGWNNGWYPWPKRSDGHEYTGGELTLKFVSTILGWILTGFAVTLGAPFWFDLLNQFMVIRSTVKPSEKSGIEASKDP